MPQGGDDGANDDGGPARTDLEPALKTLAEAAAHGDTAAFLAAYPLIDWTHRPPEDFILATRLALEAGAHLLAREIATQGAEQHPDHAEMQKYARLCAVTRDRQRSAAQSHPRG